MPDIDWDKCPQGARVTTLVEDISGDIKEIKSDVKGINGRLRAIEKWRWAITGGMLLLGSMVTLGISIMRVWK